MDKTFLISDSQRNTKDKPQKTPKKRAVLFRLNRLLSLFGHLADAI